MMAGFIDDLSFMFDVMIYCTDGVMVAPLSSCLRDGAADSELNAM